MGALVRIIGLITGGSSLPMIAILIPLGIAVGGGAVLWANHAWHSFKLSLIEQGKEECRSAVEAATALARRQYIDDVAAQAKEFQSKLADAERARQEDIARVSGIRDSAKQQHAELDRDRTPDAVNCKIPDRVIDILNRPTLIVPAQKATPGAKK
jgi:hypothetical protein